MYGVHLNVPTLDVLGIYLIKLLELLNKVLLPCLIRVSSELHLHHTRLNNRENVYEQLLAVPNLDLSPIRYLVVHTVYRLLLTLVKEHCSEILLFVGYIDTRGIH